MKILRSSFLVACLLLSFFLKAQSDSSGRLMKPKRGTFYFAWGYNKNYYSTSDVRVHDESGDYDFTLYDLKAHDHTHFEELLTVQLSIPQYGYRFGYWFPNDKFGVELKFDHPKYIVYDDQQVRLKGTINGQFYDTDTLVTANFLHLEHTDGANFLMVNFMYRKSIYKSSKIRIYGVAKYGAGIVIPRSDVTLFGQRWNHCFHNAGQVTGVELGLRTEIGRYFFIEPSVKGVFANFNKVLAINDVLISHRFWDGMILLDIGFQFPMGKSHSQVAQPNW